MQQRSIGAVVAIISLLVLIASIVFTHSDRIHRAISSERSIAHYFSKQFGFDLDFDSNSSAAAPPSAREDRLASCQLSGNVRKDL